MRLSQFKRMLSNLEQVEFRLESGEKIPEHFHVTEIGKVEKHFIDCGGEERKEESINFQLWHSDDYDHRLSAQKLKDILFLSEEKLGLKDLEIEVEYQSETIGKYNLEFDGRSFVLLSKFTDCLAKDNCGIPTEKPKMKLSEIQNKSSCTPDSGCC